MGKSFLERLARGLGKQTGKLVEKAKEKGLDKKAGELVEKAQGKIKDLVKEYGEGQEEARAREGESPEAESSENREPRAPEETTNGEKAEDGPTEDARPDHKDSESNASGSVDSDGTSRSPGG